MLDNIFTDRPYKAEVGVQLFFSFQFPNFLG